MGQNLLSEPIFLDVDTLGVKCFAVLVAFPFFFKGSAGKKVIIIRDLYQSITKT